MMTKANQRDDVAGGRLPGAAVRPRLWPLLLGLTAAAVLGVAGCLFIWGRLPDTGMLPSEHGSSAQRARQQARAELAAQEWSAVLRDGLDCAGAMAARLALDVSSGPGAAVVAVAAAPLQPPPKLSQACTTKPRLLIQVWLLQASRAEQADPQPVLVDGHGGLGALSAVARQRLRRAADSQWDSYALTPGQTQGVDQFVPVRGLDAVLLMRFAALAGQSTGRLIDAQSADHGVPIPGAHGLRVATDDTEAQQRVLATATWVLVVAGLAALLLGRYRHQCHRLAMHEQVDALNAAKRGADTLRDAANTALALAQEASHKALTAEYEANALNQQLHDEIALRRDIEESSPVGLRVIDNSGRLIEVNSAFCMACGWPREELIGKAPPYVYWPSAEIEDRQSQLAAVLNGTVDVDGYRIELVRRGEKAPWLSHVRASRLHSGKGWILSSVDITDERTRQQQIENLIEKLAQQADFFILGEKALQLAHDLTSHVLAIDQNAANLEPLVQPLLGTAHMNRPGFHGGPLG